MANSCVYNKEVYPHGSYVCQNGKCMQCQNGAWVDTGSSCGPGEDGTDCSPGLMARMTGKKKASRKPARKATKKKTGKKKTGKKKAGKKKARKTGRTSRR